LGIFLSPPFKPSSPFFPPPIIGKLAGFMAVEISGQKGFSCEIDLEKPLFPFPEVPFLSAWKSFPASAALQPRPSRFLS